MLDLSIDYYEQFRATGNLLASESCSERQLRRVLDELYPSGTDDRMTVRTRRSRVSARTTASVARPARDASAQPNE